MAYLREVGGLRMDKEFADEIRELLEEHSERTGETLEESYEHLLKRLQEVLEREEE